MKRKEYEILVSITIQDKIDKSISKLEIKEEVRFINDKKHRKEVFRSISNRLSTVALENKEILSASITPCDFIDYIEINEINLNALMCIVDDGKYFKPYHVSKIIGNLFKKDSIYNRELLAITARKNNKFAKICSLIASGNIVVDDISSNSDRFFKEESRAGRIISIFEINDSAVSKESINGKLNKLYSVFSGSIGVDSESIILEIFELYKKDLKNEALAKEKACNDIIKELNKDNSRIVHARRAILNIDKLIESKVPDVFFLNTERSYKELNKKSEVINLLMAVHLYRKSNFEEFVKMENNYVNEIFSATNDQDLLKIMNPKQKRESLSTSLGL